MWYAFKNVRFQDLPNLLGKRCLIANSIVGSMNAPDYRVAVFKEEESDSTVLADHVYWDAEKDQQYSMKEYPYFMVIDGPTMSQLKLTAGA